MPLDNGLLAAVVFFLMVNGKWSLSCRENGILDDSLLCSKEQLLIAVAWNAFVFLEYN